MADDDLREELEARLNTVPIFRGEQKRYPEWKRGFESVVDLRNYAEALDEQHESRMPASSTAAIPAGAPGDEYRKAVRQNKGCMALFNAALKGDSVGLFITNSYTTEWPRGRAWVVMQSLEERYNPKEGISKTVNLTNELAAVRMTAKQHPRTLVDTLSGIKVRYTQLGCTVTEEQLVARAVIAAPDKYKSVLATLQVARSEPGAKPMTLEDVRRAMETLYDSTNGANNTAQPKNDGEREVALSQVSQKQGKKGKKKGGGGGFRGKCRNCNKVGHKEADCTEPPKATEDAPTVRTSNVVVCGWCEKKGHTEDRCYYKPGNQIPNEAAIMLQKKVSKYMKEKGETREAQNFQLDVREMQACQLYCQFASPDVPKTLELLGDDTIWVADSGCSAHSTGSNRGMTNLCEAADDSVFVQPNGAHVKHTAVGDLPTLMHDRFGKVKGKLLLKDVKYVAKQPFNLFSTTKLQAAKWKMFGDEDKIVLSKDGFKIVFDIKIDTAKGCLFATRFIRRNAGTEAAMAAPLKMSYDSAHQLLGHCNEDQTRETAKSLGIEITRGTSTVCEACTVGKAKQKNVPKESTHEPATEDSARIFVDQATIKAKEGKTKPTKPYWEVIVDERTNHKRSTFYKTKNGMVEPTCAYINQQNLKGRPIGFVRLDNAGENRLLQTTSQSAKWKLLLDYEFTGPYTPQQNHLAELAFATLANKARALMYAANLPLELRFRLYREAIITATQLDSLIPVTINGVTASRYNHWSGGSEPKFAKYLRTWGEAGTVKTKNLGTSKLEDRGVPCMFVGYPDDHDGDVYRMWNAQNGAIYESRDIIWLKRMFYTKKVPYAKDFTVLVPRNEGLGAGEGVGDADDLGVLDESTDGDGGEVTSADEEDASTDEEDASTDEEDEEEMGASDGNNDGAEDEEAETETVVEADPTANVYPVRATTASGRPVRIPERFRDDVGLSAIHLPEYAEIPDYEQRYYNAMRHQYELSFLNIEQELHDPKEPLVETMLVGMGIGGGIDNTKELHVMKYDEAIASGDKDKWLAAVDEEHERMMKHKVFKPVRINSLPHETQGLQARPYQQPTARYESHRFYLGDEEESQRHL